MGHQYSSRPRRQRQVNFPLGCGQQVALWGDGWTHQAQCAGGRFGQGCLLLPHVQQAQPQAFLVVRTDGDPVSLSTAIREAVRSVDAGQPVYSLASMDQHIANSLGPRRFAVHLLGLFAGIAVLMAALGLYGVISYTVAQRTQEIGIALTLGAQRAQVLSLVVGHALRLAVAGVVAGAVAAFVLARLLASQLFEVSTFDPATFGTMALGLFAVAFAASYAPARRANRVDPMEALRYE